MKRNFGRGEDAVSPVIGVILMVAITVVLAAVIGAFVFGMGPGERAPSINFRVGSGTVASSNTTVALQVMGGDNVPVSSLTFKIGTTAATATGDTDTAAGNTITLTAATTDTGLVTVQAMDTATNSVIFQADVNVA
jgi:flagellin-like protein